MNHLSKVYSIATQCSACSACDGQRSRKVITGPARGIRNLVHTSYHFFLQQSSIPAEIYFGEVSCEL